MSAIRGAALTADQPSRTLTSIVPQKQISQRVDGLGPTYGAAAVMLVLLYPMCRWYRTLKAAHRHSFLRYV